MSPSSAHFLSSHFPDLQSLCPFPSAFNKIRETLHTFFANVKPFFCYDIPIFLSFFFNIINLHHYLLSLIKFLRIKSFPHKTLFCLINQLQTLFAIIGLAKCLANLRIRMRPLTRPLIVMHSRLSFFERTFKSCKKQRGVVTKQGKCSVCTFAYFRNFGQSYGPLILVRCRTRIVTKLLKGCDDPYFSLYIFCRCVIYLPFL